MVINASLDPTQLQQPLRVPCSAGPKPKLKQLSTREAIQRDKSLTRLGLYALEEFPKPVLLEIVQVHTERLGIMLGPVACPTSGQLQGRSCTGPYYLRLRQPTSQHGNVEIVNNYMGTMHGCRTRASCWNVAMP